MNWWKAWLIQLAIMLALCLVQALTYGLSPVLHGIFTWALIPVLGAYTAYRAVLRGLNNYLAWILPPLCCVVANLAVWGYVPRAGAVIVCALISVVGAAAGDVRMRQGKGR